MVSDRAPFTVEANEECEQILNSVSHYITAQGKLIRSLGNEAFLTIFNMTNDAPAGGMASDEIKYELLHTKYEDFGCRKITHWFGATADHKTKKINPPRYNHRDKVHLKAGECCNTTEVTTTLGRVLFNKLFVEPFISKIIDGGFINKSMSKKDTNALFDKVASAVEYGQLTVQEVYPWLKAIEFYAFKLVTIFAPSYTYDLFVPNKEFIKKRDEFFKTHPNPTVAEVTKFESEIIKEASQKFVDTNDEGLPLFTSGAKISFGDNYKGISVMIGPVNNPITGGWDIVKTNFMEGFKKEDIPAAGNMTVNGQYPKSCATADSGYITKQFYSAFQNATVAEDGTDCKTTGYIRVKITESNFSDYEFQNIMLDNGKYEPLTLDNKSKYVGKFVKLRSPMACIYPDKVCSACAGRRPYINGRTNIGIDFSAMPNNLLNKSMKKFHVSAVSMDTVDPDKLII